MAHVNGTHNGNGNGVDQPHTNGKSLHLKKASRKLSSPMMPAFMVSAPGKVIVFGEHAVVHGKVSARFLSPHVEALFAQSYRNPLTHRAS